MFKTRLRVRQEKALAEEQRRKAERAALLAGENYGIIDMPVPVRGQMWQHVTQPNKVVVIREFGPIPSALLKPGETDVMRVVYDDEGALSVRRLEGFLKAYKLFGASEGAE